MQRFRDVKEEMNSLGKESIVKWVCDLQQSTAIEKFLRHVLPTKVVVKFTETYLEIVAREKRTPYDLNNVKEIEMFVIKNEKETKTEIKVFGNHGMDPGVHFFDNEQDCIDFYNGLVYKLIEHSKIEKENIMNTFDDRILDLESKFISTDYVAEHLTRV